MKAIFLDIDGVLQPHGNGRRHEMLDRVPELCREWQLKANAEGKNYHYCERLKSDLCWQYDVAAVYYDWHPEAVARLKSLLEEFDAKIVLSSDWRDDRSRECMSALFYLHGLDDYFYDITATYYQIPRSFNFYRGRALNLYEQEKMNWLRDFYVDADHTMDVKFGEYLRGLKIIDEKGYFNGRVSEIREYLDRHREITSYVAVDDRDLSKGLDGHFVMTDDWIEEKDYAKMREVLGKEDGPYPLPLDCVTPQLELSRCLCLPIIYENFNDPEDEAIWRETRSAIDKELVKPTGLDEERFLKRTRLPRQLMESILEEKLRHGSIERGQRPFVWKVKPPEPKPEKVEGVTVAMAEYRLAMLLDLLQHDTNRSLGTISLYGDEVDGGRIRIHASHAATYRDDGKTFGEEEKFDNTKVKFLRLTGEYLPRVEVRHDSYLLHPEPDERELDMSRRIDSLVSYWCHRYLGLEVKTDERVVEDYGEVWNYPVKSDFKV